MSIDNCGYISINNKSSLNYFPYNESSNFLLKTATVITFDPSFDWLVGVSNFSHSNIQRVKKFVKFNSFTKVIKLEEFCKCHLFSEEIVKFVKKRNREFHLFHLKSNFNSSRNKIKFQTNNSELFEINVDFDKEYEVNDFVSIFLHQISLCIDLNKFMSSLTLVTENEFDVDKFNFSVRFQSINYICMHLNFITHQIHSDKLTKIAYVAPLDSEKKIINHHIHKIQYNRIEFPYIHEIQCKLVDEYGDEIKFVDDDILTNIILKFKKSINKRVE